MDVDELVTKVKDAVTVGRVYGEPYDKGGVTVIPAAFVMGGGGGGVGHDDTGGEGEGGGFGMRGRPAGAFVIKGEQVTWRPAVDPGRLAAAAAVVAVVWLVTRPFRLRARAALKVASAG
jgi:uncharacterized spore protein YtfJ